MIRTLLKHHIYEFCISICFDELNKNLKSYGHLIPPVGAKFSRIVDNFSGDVFIDCTVVHITKLGYWPELDNWECRNFAFGIKFKTWLDDSGMIQSDMGSDIELYDEIHFDKENITTLEFIQ